MTSQTIEMEAENKDIALLDDKALVEGLLDKQILDQIEAAHKQVPDDFFENQATAILSNIHDADTKHKVVQLGIWKKMAIAASFIAIAASTYIFIVSNRNTTQDIANNLSIQEVPTAEIESYVNANEWIAEIDWQSEINKEGSNLESINTYLKEDSNKTQ